MLATFAATFVFVLFAVLLFSIGYILTGKVRIRSGGCGRDPTKDKDGGCGTTTTCGLCKPEPDDLHKK